MVNRELYVNLGNRKISHNSIATYIQDFPIFCVFDVIQIGLRAEDIAKDIIKVKRIVKIFGGLPRLIKIFRRHIADRFIIVCDQLLLPVSIPLIGDSRIYENCESDQEQ